MEVPPELLPLYKLSSVRTRRDAGCSIARQESLGPADFLAEHVEPDPGLILGFPDPKNDPIASVLATGRGHAFKRYTSGKDNRLQL